MSDARSLDSPIIYASKSFLELTGYAENEVIGKNCRFLQAPGGNVRKGEHRKSTSSDAVSELKWSTDANRECQVSLINYRKDGRPFVNRVTVIPVPPAAGFDEVTYFVGFQVDLNESPSIIIQRIRDGNYYSSDSGRTGAVLTPAERCSRVMSKELRGIIFQSSLPLTTSANVVQEKPSPRDAQQWVDLLLLEQSGDFVHALSLKGQFLYVSPSTRDALGYEPQDLLGIAIADVCHPSDVIPLLRELKDSAAPTPSGPQSAPIVSDGTGVAEDQDRSEAQPIKTVDLLFRMRTKSKGYVWVECIGKLFTDAGKNRKAIILSGRICRMPSLQWEAISRAGGTVGALYARLECFSPTFKLHFTGARSTCRTGVLVGPFSTGHLPRRKCGCAMSSGMGTRRSHWAFTEGFLRRRGKFRRRGWRGNAVQHIP